MSDEALVSKIAFGALVLVFCGFAYFMRTPAHPVVQARGAAATPAAPASAPLPPFEIIQPDVPDGPDAPEAQADNPAPAPAPAVVKEPPRHRKSAHRVPASKVHVVRQRPAASPYANGRKHYPFDPNQRWRNGYA